MNFLKDLLPVFKKHELVFVRKNPEAGNIMTFIFRPKDKVDWKPGQHGIFVIKGRKLEGGSWRGFSVASTPQAGYIMISMRIPERPSPFKQALLDLEPGETIVMRGPFGPFYMDDPAKPAVFVAGGIGITPYRSLLYAAERSFEMKHGPIHLLYADDKGEYAYKDEMDVLADKNDFINVNYFTDSDELVKKLKSHVDEYKNGALYFISGPPAMVKSFRKTLEGMGVKGSNIRNEMFLGYK